VGRDPDVSKFRKVVHGRYRRKRKL
jgi:hypothetical protein